LHVTVAWKSCTSEAVVTNLMKNRLILFCWHPFPQTSSFLSPKMGRRPSEEKQKRW